MSKMLELPSLRAVKYTTGVEYQSKVISVFTQLHYFARLIECFPLSEFGLGFFIAMER